MKLKYVVYYCFLLFCYQIFSQYQVDIERDNVAYTTREFKENITEKYTGNDFKYDTILGEKLSAWDKFWKNIERFIDNLFGNKNIDKGITSFQLFMRIVAIGIVIVVIYLIVRVIITKEVRWVFSTSSKKIKVTENTEEDIHTIDFNTIINQAIQKENYKLAIRYYYLWLLKTFSDKGVIEWNIDKTNLDYITEIKDKETQQQFKFLSYIYEYSWYGDFKLTSIDFEKAKQAFIKNITNK